MNIHRRQILVGATAAAAGLLTRPATAAAGKMTIYKDPNCGCCHLWAEAMQKAGFEVKLVDLDDLAPIKARFGIAEEIQGCHTAEIDGYFLDGHVPLSSVKRLLAERPDIKGLAVPGMPSGSLGMGDDPQASYDVIAVPRKSGSERYIFETVRPKV